MSASRPRPKVLLHLPAGWFEVPPAGSPRKGLLRMDPYESVARRIVSSGAVAGPLVLRVRDYLRMVASADPSLLAQACRVEAPSADRVRIANIFVLGPVTVDRRPDGSPDLEQMAAGAARVRPEDPASVVERQDLPWGPALRSEYRSGEARHVGWWAWSDRLGAALVVQGGVTEDSGIGSADLWAEIAAMASTLEVERP